MTVVACAGAQRPGKRGDQHDQEEKGQDRERPVGDALPAF